MDFATDSFSMGLALPGTNTSGSNLSDGRTLPTILIVEDDSELGETLASCLDENGYQSILVDSSERAFDVLRRRPLDLILLDWNLPGHDGLEFLTQLRKFSSTPVLFESGRSELECRLKALALGADDFLVKPFALRELLARVRAILRRTSSRDTQEQMEVGGGQFDLEQGFAFLGGKRIELTKKEVEILRILLSANGEHVPAQTLNQILFPEKCQKSTNRCNVYIHRLRTKLGGNLIQSRYGFGFRIQTQPEQSEVLA